MPIAIISQKYRATKAADETQKLIIPRTNFIIKPIILAFIFENTIIDVPYRTIIDVRYSTPMYVPHRTLMLGKQSQKKYLFRLVLINICEPHFIRNAVDFHIGFKCVFVEQS